MQAIKNALGGLHMGGSNASTTSGATGTASSATSRHNYRVEVLLQNLRMEFLPEGLSRHKFEPYLAIERNDERRSLHKTWTKKDFVPTSRETIVYNERYEIDCDAEDILKLRLYNDAPILRPDQAVAEGTIRISELLGSGSFGGGAMGGSSLGTGAVGSSAIGGGAMGGSSLGGAPLAGSTMAGSNVGGSNIGGSNIGGSNIGGSNIGGSTMQGQSMPGTTTSGANLISSRQLDLPLFLLPDAVSGSSGTGGHHGLLGRILPGRHGATDTTQAGTTGAVGSTGGMAAGGAPMAGGTASQVGFVALGLKIFDLRAASGMGTTTGAPVGAMGTTGAPVGAVGSTGAPVGAMGATGAPYGTTGAPVGTGVGPGAVGKGPVMERTDPEGLGQYGQGATNRGVPPENLTVASGVQSNLSGGPASGVPATGGSSYASSGLQQQGVMGSSSGAYPGAIPSSQSKVVTAGQVQSATDAGISGPQTYASTGTVIGQGQDPSSVRRV